ncbi:pyridoxal-phosphate dependent enzyme [Nocardia cyriacigeorgica]|uniref:Pyridoxal-phosphate dependent enzyme n=1 Tax=Nocardia cyriacigeorgica TaxID=135487 RepID=A0A6P1D9W3_9NOCA|nr:pyridoxal-phosphate dependent enzyme [Nocardia cyriacigeorgica]NEW46341.1 pyridoxal-phosphate dependent enzyme [Nocardia cyriacigeorgica]
MNSLLHKRFPHLSLPYDRLGDGPTPVREINCRGLRSPVWVKDESGYGRGGWGGNKVRKLEWLLPDAHRRGTHTILTVGGLGTNWGLATALYARAYGIHTALGLIDQPVDDHIRRQLQRLRESGASLHFAHSKARLIAIAPWLFVRHAHRCRPPYYLPAGGSSALGVLGHVETALELADQVAAGAVPEPGYIVTAVGSGGTAAGLALGLRLAGLRTRVLGVVVNDTLPLDSVTLTCLAGKTARLLNSHGAHVDDAAADIDTEYGWLGPGYGHVTAAAAEAAKVAADAGLALEMTYTAKAFAALIDLDRAGRFATEPVVVLNTHGPR